MENFKKIALASLIIGGGAIIAFEVFNNKNKSSISPTIQGNANNNIVTITGQGFTPNGSVELDENSQSVGTLTASSTGTISSTITISTDGLGNGIYNYTFQAIDNTTKKTSNTITIKMSISGISNSTPSISGTLNNDIVNLLGSGFSPNGDVEIIQNSLNYESIQADGSGNISTKISISTNSLENGTYTYTYQAYDKGSNEYSNTISVVLTISQYPTSTTSSVSTTTSVSNNTPVITSVQLSNTLNNWVIYGKNLNYMSPTSIVVGIPGVWQAGASIDIMGTKINSVTSTQISFSILPNGYNWQSIQPGDTIRIWIYYNNTNENAYYQFTTNQSIINSGSTSTSSSGTYSISSNQNPYSNVPYSSSSYSSTSTSTSTQTTKTTQTSQPSGVPVISLSSNTIKMVDGATLTITGTGFVPNSTGYIAGGISQYWAYKMFSGIQIAQFTADSNGDFSVTTTYEFNQTTVSGLANALKDSNPTYIYAYDYANDVGTVNVEMLTGN
ncbi:MAG: hypothetical protein ACP5U0_08095 [Caldisphaera sp.]